MISKWRILLSVIAIGSSPAMAWELPPDNGIMGKDAVATILAENDYPGTTGYIQSTAFSGRQLGS